MNKQGTYLVARVLFYLLFSIVIVFWGFQVSAIEWTEAQKEMWKTMEAY